MEVILDYNEFYLTNITVNIKTYPILIQEFVFD